MVRGMASPADGQALGKVIKDPLGVIDDDVVEGGGGRGGVDGGGDGEEGGGVDNPHPPPQPLVRKNTLDQAKNVLPLCHSATHKWEDGELKLRPASNVPKSEKPDDVVLCPEAVELLRDIKQPLVVILITGPARTGKSYIISKLCNEIQFELGHTPDTQTKGIWMAKIHPEIKVESESYSGPARLLLLDTEGLGSLQRSGEGEQGASSTWDEKIGTLSILMSSTFVYNSQGVPNKDDIEKIHFMGKFAQNIDGAGNDGKTSSVPRRSNASFMPSFVWLIRDHVLRPKNDDGSAMSMEAYLNGIIQGDQLKEYKDAFQMVEEFHNFEVMTLPPPHHSPDIIKTMNSDGAKYLNPKFVTGVNDVRDSLLAGAQLKCTGQHLLLTGATFADLVEDYVKDVNEVAAGINCGLKWKASVDNLAREAREECFSNYKSLFLEKLQLPCPESRLDSSHSAAKDDALGRFDDLTRVIRDEAMRQRQRDAISLDCDEVFNGKMKLNAEKSRTVAVEIMNELIDEFESDLDAAIVECSPCSRCFRCRIDSIGHLNELKEELKRQYEKQVPDGPAKAAVIEENSERIETKLSRKSRELDATCNCSSACFSAIARCCGRMCRRKRKKGGKGSEKKSDGRDFSSL